MDGIVFAVVLVAALLHATWNGFVKNHNDKTVAVTGIVLGHAPLSLLAILYFPAPNIDSYIFIIISIFIHQGYQWFLLRSYQVGDLTKVYPIARGTGPLITTFISILFLGVVLDKFVIFSILLLCFGIFLLGANNYKKSNFNEIKYPLITGVFIGSYSLIDGYGARISESAISFMSWSFLINALIFPFVLGIIGEKKVLQRVYNEGKKIFFYGVTLSYASYALVVWAFTKAPIPVVTSLRETSILLSIFIGYFLLKEKMNLLKISSIVIILIGVIGIKLF